VRAWNLGIEKHFLRGVGYGFEWAFKGVLAFQGDTTTEGRSFNDRGAFDYFLFLHNVAGCWRAVVWSSEEFMKL
jgi:hypothetical protein